ncbi:hypothetical protein REPUB_Repub01dG0262500 [Reevesia pubescens]
MYFNRLNTNVVRANKGMNDSSLCPTCLNELETIEHIMQNCSMTVQVWRKFRNDGGVDEFLTKPFREWVKGNCLLQVDYESMDWNVLFTCTIWSIWKHRNARIFEGQNLKAGEICGYARKLRKDVKKETEKASAEGLLKDEQRVWIKGFLDNIGRTDSLRAELWGMKEGQRLAKKVGCLNIIIQSDANMVINILDSEVQWDNHPLGTLVVECRQLLRKKGFTLLISVFLFKLKVMANRSLYQKVACSLSEDPLYPCWQRACLESVFRVMPLTRNSAEAFGVLTICLVALLILLGVVCIAYSFYLHSRVLRQGFFQLSYFSGPWIIRITFILFAIWWGFGEILRLNFLRRQGRVLNALNLKWQENVCKCYIVSNLGFAEPCLFLTLVFLLRAPLQNMDTGILSRKWNGKTTGYVLLYCLPVFVLQLIFILIGPDRRELPPYFTRTAAPVMQNSDDIALCTYPLLNTIILGLFATFLTAYLFWLGRRILKLVINKGLQKRVYTLIFSVSSFLPLRVLLLGLSVLSKPEHFLFEALAFSAFFVLLCCAGVCICMLVYYPVADCLALGNLHDLEVSRRAVLDDQNDTVSLIANQSHLEESVGISPERNSDASTKRGSISFRTYERDGTSTGAFVELSLFSTSQDVTPSGSPPLLGWPSRPPSHVH